MNFVLWGAYHGVLLLLPGRCAERAPVRTGFDRLLRQLGCFHLVVFGWLLFRVTSMDNFLEYVDGLLAASGGTRLHPAYYAVLGLGVVTHLLSWDRAAGLRQRFQAQPLPVQAGLYAILLLAFCGATLEAPSFIYFQF